jgi:hypothetical protein
LETNSDNKEEALDRLSAYTTYADLKNYKEEDGAIHRYIQDWKAFEENSFKRNDFAQAQATGLISKQSCEDSYLLSDGLEGFASDFNQGWFLAGEDIVVDGIFHNESGRTKRFTLRCLVYAKHRMLVPDHVEFFCNGRKVATYTADDFELQSGVAVLEREVELEKNGTVQLRIYKSKDIKKSVIACDEIRIY